MWKGGVKHWCGGCDDARRLTRRRRLHPPAGAPLCLPFRLIPVLSPTCHIFYCVFWLLVGWPLSLQHVPRITLLDWNSEVSCSGVQEPLLRESKTLECFSCFFNLVFFQVFYFMSTYIFQFNWVWSLTDWKTENFRPCILKFVTTQTRSSTLCIYVKNTNFHN